MSRRRDTYQPTKVEAHTHPGVVSGPFEQEAPKEGVVLGWAPPLVPWERALPEEGQSRVL